MQKFWTGWLFDDTLRCLNTAHAAAVEERVAPVEKLTGQLLPDNDVVTTLFLRRTDFAHRYDLLSGRFEPVGDPNYSCKD